MGDGIRRRARPSATACRRVAPGKRLWAEDGAVFLADAINEPVTAALRSHAGRGPLAPRLLSAPLRAVQWWPELVVFACTAVTVLAVAAVYLFAARSGLGRWVAVAAGLLPVVVAGLRFESLVNIANLHWILT